MQRLGLIIGFLSAVILLSVAVWSYGFRQALTQLSEQAEADLALAADGLGSQLQVYQELAVLMAAHPSLRQLDSLSKRREAGKLLLEVSDKTAAVDVLFADTAGRVMAAAHDIVRGSVRDHPAFIRAMHGALGNAHQSLKTRTDSNFTWVPPGGANRIYTYAAPAFDADGQVIGALMVIADVEDVERTWRGSTEAVFFVDDAGLVFISNRSDLLFWRRAPGQVGLSPQDGEAEFSVFHSGPHELWRMEWGPYLPQTALHLARELPVIGMTGEVLMDVAPAVGWRHCRPRRWPGSVWHSARCCFWRPKGAAPWPRLMPSSKVAWPGARGR